MNVSHFSKLNRVYYLFDGGHGTILDKQGPIIKFVNAEQDEIRYLLPGIEATRYALWNETALKPPELFGVSLEKVLLADDRLHRTPHEDVIAPGQARNLRLDLVNSNGSEIRRGFVQLGKATIVNDGLTVQVFSTCGNEAAELSIGPGIQKLRSSLDRDIPLRLNSVARVPEAITLVNVSQYNYFHFVAQTLPTLAVIYSQLPRSIPLIMGGEFSTGNSFGAQLMRSLFSELNVGFIPVGNSLYVDRLIGVPPTTTNIFEPTGLHIVRDMGRSLMDVSQSTKGSRVVFLARGDNERNRRKLLNEGAVISLLTKKWPDTQVLVPGLRTVEEQMGAISNAQIIVGLHGSQLTNMIWAPPSATVIEIVPDDMDTSDLFAAQGKALGLNYLTARSMGVERSHWSNTDQVADLTDLLSILRRIS